MSIPVVRLDGAAMTYPGPPPVSALYPVLWATSRLDALLWLQPGYKLFVRARLAHPTGATDFREPPGAR